MIYVIIWKVGWMKIQVIRKTNRKIKGTCNICCLSGLCMDAKLNCFEGDYFILKDPSIKLTKYEFEVENDNVE